MAMEKSIFEQDQRNILNAGFFHKLMENNKFLI